MFGGKNHKEWVEVSKDPALQGFPEQVTVEMRGWSGGQIQLCFHCPPHGDVKFCFHSLGIWLVQKALDQMSRWVDASQTSVLPFDAPSAFPRSLWELLLLGHLLSESSSHVAEIPSHMGRPHVETPSGSPHGFQTTATVYCQPCEGTTFRCSSPA